MSDGLKVLLGALGGAVLILLLISVFGGGGMMGGMGSMMSGGMMGGGLFRMLFALVFWVLGIALIVALWSGSLIRPSATRHPCSMETVRMMRDRHCGGGSGTH